MSIILGAQPLYDELTIRRHEADLSRGSHSCKASASAIQANEVYETLDVKWVCIRRLVALFRMMSSAHLAFVAKSVIDELDVRTTSDDFEAEADFEPEVDFEDNGDFEPECVWEGSDTALDSGDWCTKYRELPEPEFVLTPLAHEVLSQWAARDVLQIDSVMAS